MKKTADSRLDDLELKDGAAVVGGTMCYPLGFAGTTAGSGERTVQTEL